MFAPRYTSSSHACKELYDLCTRSIMKLPREQGYSREFSSLPPSLSRLSLLLLLLLTAPVLGEQLEDTGESCSEEEERSFDSEVRVATLQFEELQVVLLVVVFIIIVVFAKLGEADSLHNR